MLKFSSFEALTSPRHRHQRHQRCWLLCFPDLRQLKFQPTFAFPESQEPPKYAAEPPKFSVEPLYFAEEPPYFAEEPVYPQILSRIRLLICVSAKLRPRSLGGRLANRDGGFISIKGVTFRYSLCTSKQCTESVQCFQFKTCALIQGGGISSRQYPESGQCLMFIPESTSASGKNIPHVRLRQYHVI